jgi:3-dehydroquinate dehydratase/shikimate dehydrogenase
MNNGKICVSVCAKTAGELIEQIKHAEELADVIEIRFDCLPLLNLENISDRLLISKIQKLKKECKVPFLITFRAFEEGGAQLITLNKHLIPFWKNQKLGLPEYADLVDCEWETLSNIKSSSMFLQNVKRSKIICSFHNFNAPIKNLKTLENIFSRMQDLKLIELKKRDKQQPRLVDVSKIVVQTNDISDSIPIWQLLERAKSENKEIIPIAMGESGKWTRILGLAHGAFMTYASLDSDKETAPGQVTVKDLIEVYRAKELDETTEVYGIIGSNTGISLSPLIHNTAFKFHGLNSVLVPFQVHDLDEFIKRMVKPETREINLNFRGLAVTIPHKQTIIKHLDYLDETAEKIGAVNTVKMFDGKLHGYNTDAEGFLVPLKKVFGKLENAKVAIFGSGGSAKACQYALEKENAAVTIFPGTEIRDSNFKSQSFSGFDILVNTTPLGMKGKAEGETPISAEQMKGVKIVYDLVYVPAVTEFIKQAQSIDIPVIGGIEMLLGQACEQQKIWTGRNAPIDEINNKVLKKLNN